MFTPTEHQECKWTLLSLTPEEEHELRAICFRVGEVFVSALKVRWGLIRCGDISQKRVAPALCDSDLCELVAVSTAQSELADSFAREFGAQRWYRDWRELLLDHEIDAVYRGCTEKWNLSCSH